MNKELKNIIKEETEDYKRFNINLINLERFAEFLEDELSEPNYLDYPNTLHNWIEKLIERHGETGTSSFELNGYYTKNKLPAIFSYDWSFEWDEENEEPISETYEF